MLWQALKLSSGFGSTLIQSLSQRILFILNLTQHCKFITKGMVAIRISKAEPNQSPCKALHGDGTEHEDEVSDGRLEKTAKRAFVGAGARVLFYPTLLYNVVRNKLQPEFRWWDEIDQLQDALKSSEDWWEHTFRNYPTSQRCECNGMLFGALWP